MDDRPTFPEWIKQTRKQLGLGRAELAQQVGCSLAMLRQLEYGTRRPSRQLAERLANFLQIPAEQQALFVQTARVHQPPSPINPIPLVKRLPEPTQPLIGREEVLTNASQLLLQPSIRLLSIVGPGGVGKTHFATQLAQQIQANFSDGSFFIGLVSLHDAEQLPTLIAQMLEIPQPTHQSTLEQVIDAIGQRSILLVLDNLEHVMMVVPIISQLIAQSSKLKMLITSRFALKLHAEHLIDLPPLDVPQHPLEQQANAETSYSAVELFELRAKMVQPQFRLTAQNRAIVGEICRRLDGLPLAIELAAARIRGLPPQAMLARLDRRLELFDHVNSDLPERHQTLRNLIAWSYTLLTPNEQTIFRTLSLFAKHWTLDAAEYLCQAQIAKPQVLTILLNLLDKSLVREESSNDGLATFAMLEIIREYGLEQLEQTSEAQALRWQHAHYYLQLAQQAEQQLGQQEARWLERLTWERSNLWDALNWLVAQQAAEPLLQLIGSLWKFWQIRHLWREGLHWIELALALPMVNSEAYQQARAKVLWGAGWLAVDLHQHDLAQAMFEQSLHLATSLDDQQGIARALHGVGLLAEWAGQRDFAMRAYQESLSLFRQLGDQEEIAWSLFHLGAALQSQGQAKQAQHFLEAALATSRRLAHSWSIVHQTKALGQMAIDQGRYADAELLLNESLTLAQSHQYQQIYLEILRHLGRSALEQGHYQQARERFQTSLEQAQLLKEPSAIRWASIHLNWLGILAGDLAQAYAFEQQLAIFERDEPAWAIAWLKARLGTIALLKHQLEVAQSWFLASMQIYQANDLPWGLVECLEGLAHSLCLSNQANQAASCLQLLSAAEQQRQSLPRVRSVPEQAAWQASLAWCQQQLSPEQFAHIWQTGATQKLEQLLKPFNHETQSA